MNLDKNIRISKLTKKNLKHVKRKTNMLDVSDDATINHLFILWKDHDEKFL